MFKKRYWYLLGGVLSFCLGIGCLGSYFKTSKVNKSDRFEAIREKVLNLNFSEGDIPSLDPHLLTLEERGIALGKLIFEGLTRLNSQGDYELAGAENIDIAPCKTHYVFTLRPNFYSDQTPVSAYDYEACWKKALAPHSRCGKGHLFYFLKGARKAKKEGLSLENIGVKALDEKTLVVDLDRPTPYVLTLLAMPLFSPYKEEKGEIIGSGPYLVDKWKKGESLSLKVNPCFWDRKHIAIDTINISMIGDEGSCYYLYEKGEIDWSGPPFSSIPTEELLFQYKRGKLLSQRCNEPFWLYLNTESFPLTSPLIRKALSEVIERKAIAEHIFVGAKTVSGLLLKECDKCDEERGKNLFKEGIVQLGLTPKEFPPLTLSCSHLTRHKKVAKYVQERWQKVFGIEVRLDIQEWNTFYSHLQKGDYQIGGSFFSIDYDDPVAYFEPLALPINIPRWNHTQFSRLIHCAKSAQKEELKERYLQEAEAVFQEEMPVIPLINQVLYYSHPEKLKGVVFDHLGIPDFRWAYLKEN